MRSCVCADCSPRTRPFKRLKTQALLWCLSVAFSVRTCVHILLTTHPAVQDDASIAVVLDRARVRACAHIAYPAIQEDASIVVMLERSFQDVRGVRILLTTHPTIQEDASIVVMVESRA